MTLSWEITQGGDIGSIHEKLILIENIIHRSRNVHFGEEASSIHKDHAPENMCYLRSVAIACLKKQAEKLTETIKHFQRFPKQFLKLLTEN